MIDFVGTPLFLKIILWIAMETMHFRITGISLFLRTIFFAFRGGGGAMVTLAPMRNCPGDER